MKNNFSVSISDLILHPSLQGEDKNISKKLESKEFLNNILWDFGLDTNLKYTERVCSHRNIQQQVVENCVRFEGQERTDHVWLNSGASTIDAGVDNEMINELKQFRTSSAISE